MLGMGWDLDVWALWGTAQINLYKLVYITDYLYYYDILLLYITIIYIYITIIYCYNILL